MAGTTILLVEVDGQTEAALRARLSGYTLVRVGQGEALAAVGLHGPRAIVVDPTSQPPTAVLEAIAGVAGDTPVIFLTSDGAVPSALPLGVHPHRLGDIDGLVARLERGIDERGDHDPDVQDVLPDPAAALRESEARLRIALQAGHMGIWEWHLRDRTVSLSHEAEQILGVDRARTRDMAAFEDRIHPQDAAMMRTTAEEAIARGDYHAEFRIVRPDGQIRWIESRGQVVRDRAGKAARITGVMVDITDRKHAEAEREHLLMRSQIARAEAEAAAARLRRLQAVADATLGHLGLDQLIAETLERIRQVLVADAGAITLATDDGAFLELKGIVGIDLDDLPSTYFPTGEGMIGRAVGSRDALLIEDLKGTPDETDLVRRTGLRSAMILPLFAGETLIGSLAVASRTPSHFTREDLRLLKLVADRLALSVVQARLYEAEQRAREEAERDALETARLHSATAALAGALTLDDVARVVIDEGLGSLGAVAGSLAMIDHETGEIEVVANAGYAPDLVERFRRFTRDEDLPFAEVIRSGKSLFLSSTDERNARFARLAAVPGAGALACLPLTIGGSIAGALGISFDGEQLFDERAREFLTSLAERCQVALERASLYEAEQRARVAAEEARRRLEFLAEATTILASSFDAEVSLRSLARLSVPTMADWCVVYIVDGDGEIQRLALEHGDPAKAEIAKLIETGYPLDADAPEGVPMVIRTGEPALYEVATPEQLSSDVRGAEELQSLIAPLDVRSWMCVPLIARGRTLGAISFISTTPERAYRPDDLTLAADLARRAALLVDNARLFSEVRDAEERYRSLVQTVEAIVWEAQPDPLRFTFVSGRAEDILGYPSERWLGDPSFWASIVHPEDIPDVLAAYRAAASEPGTRDVEYRVTTASKRVVWLRDLVYAERDSDAGMVTLRGLSVDVTSRKETERRLEGQYAMTRVLAETGTLADAQPRILQVLARHLDWTVGAFWTLDDDEHLACVEFWHEDGHDVPVLEAETRGRRFRRGEGLPGATWESGTPTWLDDLSKEPGFERGETAKTYGLTSGVAFPLTSGGAVVGIVEFFCDDHRPREEALIEMMAALGRQIGQFIERKRAEEAVLFNQVLLRSQNEATLDGILVVSPSGEMISWNERFVEMWSIPPGVMESKQDQLAIQHVLANVLDPQAFVDRIAWLYEHPDAESHDEIALFDGRIVDRWSAPLRSEEGTLYGRAWYFRDISERKRAERETRQSEERFAFLAEASTLLASSLDHTTSLRGLAELAVPYLADWCMVDLVHEDGIIERVAVAHRDPAARGVAETLRAAHLSIFALGTYVIADVLQRGVAEVTADVDDAVLERLGGGVPEQVTALRALGITAAMSVPLVARGRVLGTMTFLAAGSGRRYGRTDLALAEDLAHRTGLSIDNARLYREKSNVARTLQDGLLPPELPAIPGVEVAARYRYAGEGSEIGGDFYDIFAVKDGDWALVIGDVCGKGAEAAAVTALARYTVRAVAMHTWKPSRILGALNEAMVKQREDDRFCTVAYARLRLLGEGARITIACGGHPSPVILRADGRVEPVGHNGLLLGIFPDAHLRDRTTDLHPGDSIIFYTDGVTEARNSGGIFGEASLLDLIGGCTGLTASEIAERIDLTVFDFQAGDLRDDAALIVVRIPPS